MAIRKKEKKRNVLIEPQGVVHIRASFNNIIITITNLNGDVITWSSAGKMKFKGSKKNTPYAAQCVAEDCSKVAHELGVKRVTVLIKGPGVGRDSAVRTLQNSGFEIIAIKDMTSLPHNGCRPPKRRRM